MFRGRTRAPGKDAARRTGGAVMAFPSSCRVHPTAIVSPEATLGDNVEVGPYCVIDGPVLIGAGTILRPGVCLYGPMSLGKNNTVYTGAILGERAKKIKYNGETTTPEIGDRNIIREHVTIHSGTTYSMKTVVGNDNFFMVNSHV